MMFFEAFFQFSGPFGIFSMDFDVFWHFFSFFGIFCRDSYRVMIVIPVASIGFGTSDLDLDLRSKISDLTSEISDLRSEI